jgi:hypothetical protein
MERIFSDIYKNHVWGSIKNTVPERKAIIDLLPPLFKKYKIKTLLDLPCGYRKWMKDVDLTGIKYIGADIVTEVIESNKEEFQQYKFMRLDITTDKLPKADLLLCRDCLVHLTYQEIEQALRNIANSQIKYLLATTFTDRITAHDIKTGEWRPINLQEAPFNLPGPLTILNEKCMEGGGQFQDKSLGLWNILQLRRRYA